VHAASRFFCFAGHNRHRCRRSIACTGWATTCLARPIVYCCCLSGVHDCRGSAAAGTCRRGSYGGGSFSRSLNAAQRCGLRSSACVITLQVFIFYARNLGYGVLNPISISFFEKKSCVATLCKQVRDGERCNASCTASSPNVDLAIVQKLAGSGALCSPLVSHAVETRVQLAAETRRTMPLVMVFGQSFLSTNSCIASIPCAHASPSSANKREFDEELGITNSSFP
jgi:hypothetical protein